MGGSDVDCVPQKGLTPDAEHDDVSARARNSAKDDVGPNLLRVSPSRTAGGERTASQEEG